MTDNSERKLLHATNPEIDELADAVSGDNDDVLDEVTRPDDYFRDVLADLERKPYTVVERTEKCGKDVCACTDAPDAAHGPYRYHVYTDPDGSRRWEYQGPAYDL